MKIVQIIDSLELNGGSTMFLELVSGMRRYWEDAEIVPYVVSKTGLYGRKHIVSDLLPKSYDIHDLQVYNYERFQPVANELRDAVIFHHVLGHTRCIKFHSSCQYIVVNHITTNMKRLKNFNASRIVSVCKYHAEQLKRRTGLRSHIILNGCEDYSHISPTLQNKDKIIIGRCQRLVPNKFNTESVKSLGRDNCIYYAMGPKSFKKEIKNVNFLGPIFDRNKKLGMLRSFDYYLHDTKSPEGASMAILEALSCGIPVLTRNVGGGTNEIIRGGINGYFFRNGEQLRKIVYSSSREKIKKVLHNDFMSRLHISRVLRQYKELIS